MTKKSRPAQPWGTAQITDHHGQRTGAQSQAALDAMLADGCVLLINGESGTAVQRFYSDGLFHSATGHVYTEADLLAQPNLIHLYSPAPEED